MNDLGAPVAGPSDLGGPLKDLSTADFAIVRDYVHEHSGIFLEDSRIDSLRISIVTRATGLGITGFAEYYRRLVADEDEFRGLMNLVTINETSFLRFPAQFAALRDEVVPELMARTGASRALRIWSAGCSTGEEAYTIAMMLLDSGAAVAGWHFEVLGTDVSTRALEVARNAVYPVRALSGLPTEMVARHFEPVDEERFRVAEAVRRLVTFRYHNLIKEPYPASLLGEWDVIFCRNVTIYFKVESTRRVVQGFSDSLVVGGYLFVGHSETLTTITTGFETVERGGVFLYRKPIDVAAPRSAEEGVVRPAGVGWTGEGGWASRPPRVGDEAAGRGSVASAAPTFPGALRPGGRLEAAAHVVELAAEGTAALAKGDIGAAHAIAARIAAIDPSSAQAPLLEARASAEEGDLEAAAASCQRALGINPLLPGARYLLGIVQTRRGDVVEAERELRKTVYIDGDFALAHLNLATLYRSQQRWEEACGSFESAVRAARSAPTGAWTAFLGGFDVEVFARTAQRGLVECRKASGTV
jgi:chemotaxis protein methyltransferase CheR